MALRADNPKGKAAGSGVEYGYSLQVGGRHR